MSRAVEEALEGVLDEVLYGETPVPTVVRAPTDRRLVASVEAFSAPLELPQLLAFTGHEFWRGSREHRCLWRSGAGIGDPGSDASFDDLESVAADYERYVKMERRERLDADRIKLGQIRSLRGEAGSALANALQRWNRTVRETVRSMIQGARGTWVAQLLDAENLDTPELHRAFADLVALGGDITHHAQEAQRVLRRVEQKGQLHDDDAQRLLGAFDTTLAAAAQHLGAHAHMGSKEQSALFGAAIGLLRQAELALQHPGENRVVKPLGNRLEAAAAARVLDALDRHPPWAAAVSEVWMKVSVAASRRPEHAAAEYDVLLVLKNALLLNIECKAGTIDNKDLDARTAVQGRAVSALAEMWVCSLLPTAKADAPWFETAHQTRQKVLAQNRNHLPFTWSGQPRRYTYQDEVFECPSFEETLESLMRRFAPPEDAKAGLEATAQADD
ncbi:MAG: hypothetical protein JNN03_00920 [Rubrivivax sp.]|nr:hypothetical protein [Rubrivivax sp.]